MFKEKLNKKLAAAIEEAGITEPKEMQAQLLTKINSGADVIGIGPLNSGRSTLINIATVQKLQRAFEDAPRALILVSNKEKAEAMAEQFMLFAKDTDLRVVTVFEEGKIDKQTMDIYVGTDVVIATAKRIIDIYFKRTFNLTKIKLFVIDDAETMIENAWQGHVDRLALSLPKCQHLVFTNNLDAKVERLIQKFIIAPHVVEVTEM
ncbi:MAG: DEAD/DEAH box helicase [Bacteroidia bacterium]